MNRKSKFTSFDFIIYAIATILLIVVLYPLILVVSNSLSDPVLVASGEVVFLPKGFNLAGYKAVFADQNIMTGYANTIFYTVFGTIINLIVTLPAGYALTKQMPAKGFITGMMLFTMYFSGGLIPTFLWLNKLGLYGSRWAILLDGAFHVYNCIICRSFFNALPVELEEAAEIDGCNPFRIFARIVLPLSKALLGVMVLYFGVSRWNSYFTAMIYLDDDSKMPLQVFLRRILILAQSALNSDEGGEYALELLQREALIRYAVIVVAALPLMIIYPFLQKYFDKGVLIGSVKG